MPRPRKRKTVCQLPVNDLFGPINNNFDLEEIISMKVEEYECIRLIDFEGLNQEECSESLGVARTTVQRLYNDARKKIATAIVNGQQLKIEGGSYKMCDVKVHPQGCGYCRRRHNRLMNINERKGE